ncbi:MAG: sulfur carrier protein ThiS [Alphaproteobacteria bacterium]|nr:sulfur carrier protein ThiS [Alphaproteobacteria bacterium]
MRPATVENPAAKPHTLSVIPASAATEDQLTATTTTTTTSATTFEVTVNGEPHATSAATLDALVGELDFAGVRVATAVNGDFVPAGAREKTPLEPGDKIEIVSARQGG